jgi:hypothetical protein
MSLSNPNSNAPNPSVRWFEWNGEQGGIRYYDKDAKQNVDVPMPFAFSLLDELASVSGWHEASQSGIYSNEVRDTSKEVLVVKSFKGGTIEEGFYREIKDQVNAAGGSYTAKLYVAFKHEGALAIGCIRFKGAALMAWMDYRKAHRGELYSKALAIVDVSEGKKGRVTYKMPVFKSVERSAETTNIAKALDAELQQWLTSYFASKRRDQAERTPSAHEPEPELVPAGHGESQSDVTDSDIPF